MKTAEWLFNHIEEIVGSVLVSLIVVLLTWSILGRALFDMGWPWHDEVVRIAFVYVILFGISDGAKKGTHIRVAIVSLRLPPKPRAYLALATDVIWLAFNAAIIVYGFDLVHSMSQYIQTSPILRLDMSKVYLAIPATIALTSFRIVQRYYIHFKKNNTLLMN